MFYKIFNKHSKKTDKKFSQQFNSYKKTRPSNIKTALKNLYNMHLPQIKAFFKDSFVSILYITLFLIGTYFFLGPALIEYFDSNRVSYIFNLPLDKSFLIPSFLTGILVSVLLSLYFKYQKDLKRYKLSKLVLFFIKLLIPLFVIIVVYLGFIHFTIYKSATLSTVEGSYWLAYLILNLILGLTIFFLPLLINRDFDGQRFIEFLAGYFKILAWILILGFIFQVYAFTNSIILHPPSDTIYYLYLPAGVLLSQPFNLISMVNLWPNMIIYHATSAWLTFVFILFILFIFVTIYYWYRAYEWQISIKNIFNSIIYKSAIGITIFYWILSVLFNNILAHSKAIGQEVIPDTYSLAILTFITYTCILIFLIYIYLLSLKQRKSQSLQTHKLALRPAIFVSAFFIITFFTLFIDFYSFLMQPWNGPFYYIQTIGDFVLILYLLIPVVWLLTFLLINLFNFFRTNHLNISFKLFYVILVIFLAIFAYAPFINFIDLALLFETKIANNIKSLDNYAIPYYVDSIVTLKGPNAVKRYFDACFYQGLVEPVQAKQGGIKANGGYNVFQLLANSNNTKFKICKCEHQQGRHLKYCTDLEDAFSSNLNSKNTVTNNDNLQNSTTLTIHVTQPRLPYGTIFAQGVKLDIPASNSIKFADILSSLKLQLYPHLFVITWKQTKPAQVYTSRKLVSYFLLDATDNPNTLVCTQNGIKLNTKFPYDFEIGTNNTYTVYVVITDINASIVSLSHKTKLDLKNCNAMQIFNYVTNDKKTKIVLNSIKLDIYTENKNGF